MTAPVHALNIPPGSRVLISFIKKNGVGCGACIVEMSTSKPFGESYEAVLDEPMNEMPTQKNIDTARKYSIDANCVLSIAVGTIGKEYDIYPFDLDKKSAPDYTLLLCSCGSIQTRSSMFVCDRNHCYCWKHIVPWNDTLRVPDTKEVQPFSQFLSQVFPQATYITTRALLYFTKWKTATSRHDRFNVALESLQEDICVCPSCQQDMTVADLRLLLFPPPPLFRIPQEKGMHPSPLEDPGNAMVDKTQTTSGPVCNWHLLPMDTQVFVTDLDRFVFVDRAGEGWKPSRPESQAVSLVPLCTGGDEEWDRFSVTRSSSLNGSVCAVPLMLSLSTTVSCDFVLQQLAKRVQLRKGWNLEKVQMALLQAVYGVDSPIVQECQYDIYRVENEGDSPATWGGVITYACSREICGDDDPLRWHCQILVDSTCRSAMSRTCRQRDGTKPIGKGQYDTEDDSALFTANTHTIESDAAGTDGVVLVREIQPDWVFTLRCPTDNIGPACRLHLLESPFNTSQLLKMKELSLRYRGWRQIRGDGNCYYRAAGVGFIENAIIAGCSYGVGGQGDAHGGSDSVSVGRRLRRRAFGHLWRLLSAAGRGYVYEHERESHTRLLKYIRRAKGEGSRNGRRHFSPCSDTSTCTYSSHSLIIHLTSKDLFLVVPLTYATYLSYLLAVSFPCTPTQMRRFGLLPLNSRRILSMLILGWIRVSCGGCDRPYLTTYSPTSMTISTESLCRTLFCRRTLI